MSTSSSTAIDRERAEARQRFLALAAGDTLARDAIRAHPLVSVGAGLMAGFLAARRDGGTRTLLLLARLWLGNPRGS